MHECEKVTKEKASARWVNAHICQVACPLDQQHGTDTNGPESAVILDGNHMANTVHEYNSKHFDTEINTTDGYGSGLGFSQTHEKIIGQDRAEFLLSIEGGF
jgi:hypothetical protein